MNEVKDRQFLIAVHKKAKKKGFDLTRYNRLREEAHDIESNLLRLHDPLRLRHSPNAGFKITNANDQIIQMALSTKLDGEHLKPTLTERLASIFESTTKKFKK